MAKRVLLFIISLVLIAGMGTFIGLKVHKMQNTQDQLNAQAQAEAQQEAVVTSAVLSLFCTSAKMVSAFA